MGEILSPAAYVIRVFGGVSALARAVDRDHSSVSKWQTDSGGKIPSGAMEKILIVAKAKGLDVTATDLILGRKL